jgi:pullulanase
MKFIFLLFFPFFALSQINSEEYTPYAGNDLGVHYTSKQTVFKIWAPTASAVRLKLYKSGIGGESLQTVLMSKVQQGVWQTNIAKDIKNAYYTFEIQHKGKWLGETPDIYAKAVGVNGARGMVVNMLETNPTNWNDEKKPALKNSTEIVLYESHVRDFSISNNSGIKQKGKYLGMVELGTKNTEGLSTGIDHLKELGITHIHLLPTFDFNSIDESKPELNAYNWGYDPLNYNVPEGSFSSNPYDGKVRIREFKQMVQTFHQNGIRVIMDVVYNHTSNLQTPFNKTVPGYYYRKNADGSYSDASACGNETASEKTMMRKFMVASAVYWAKEYHIDGFRFDLMGIHDIETMNQISDSLKKIDPSIFIYGEGWTAGASPLPENLQAIKKNTYQLNKIAAFSDDIRDALRGPYNRVKEKGFVSGSSSGVESLKFGIVAATPHPQIEYSKVNYSKAAWASEPGQSINYVSCHDDNTLFDRLAIANPDVSEAELIKMDKLSQTVVFTSQGIAFLHSGAEILRTKKGVANSYKSPDSINEIDWNRKSIYRDVFNFYKSLVLLRKNHPAFRMTSTKMVQDHLAFINTDDSLLLAYQINNHANGDSWKDILVLINGNSIEKNVDLPTGNWTLAVDGLHVNEKGIKKITTKITIPSTTAFVLYKLD